MCVCIINIIHSLLYRVFSFCKIKDSVSKFNHLGNCKTPYKHLFKSSHKTITQLRILWNESNLAKLTLPGFLDHQMSLQQMKDSASFVLFAMYRYIPLILQITRLFAIRSKNPFLDYYDWSFIIQRSVWISYIYAHHFEITWVRSEWMSQSVTFKLHLQNISYLKITKIYNLSVKFTVNS